MSSTSSVATIQKLREVFSRFGLPDRVISDNAPNFVSAEFTEFMKNNGIKHSMSAPYHPAAERAVKTFKAGMKKMTEGTLQQKLARLLFSYRTTPHSTTGVCPAELLMNRKLKSALDLVNPSRQVTTHDKQVQSRSFSLGDIVYVRNYGQGPKWIHGTILDRAGPYNFSVQVTVAGQLTKWKRHVELAKLSVTCTFGCASYRIVDSTHVFFAYICRNPISLTHRTKARYLLSFHLNT